MAFEALIAKYGLLAIFLGAGVEGEAVVVTGGILAHQGLVPLWPACALAAAGSCLVDQIWFQAGRRYRDHRWVRAITRRPAYRRAIGWLERRPTAFILAFRFIYGLRTVSPIAIGTSNVSTRKFVILNVIAASVWGPSLTLLGYGLGKAAMPLLERGLHDLLIGVAVVLAAVVLIGVAIALVRRRRSAG